MYFNIQDFVHVFAVLSVGYLIFGTKDNILNIFFSDDDGQSIFKKPEKIIKDELRSEIINRNEDITEIAEKAILPYNHSTSPKSEIYGTYTAHEITTEGAENRSKQQKVYIIQRIKSDTIEVFTNSLEKSIKFNELRNKIEIFGNKFTAISIYLGLSSFLLLLLSSWTHEYYKYCAGTGLRILIISINIFMIIHFGLVSQRRMPEFGSRDNAIIIFIIKFCACVIPFFSFITLIQYDSLNYYNWLWIYAFIPIGIMLFFDKKRFEYYLLSFAIIILQLSFLKSDFQSIKKEIHNSSIYLTINYHKKDSLENNHLIKNENQLYFCLTDSTCILIAKDQIKHEDKIVNLSKGKLECLSWNVFLVLLLLLIPWVVSFFYIKNLINEAMIEFEPEMNKLKREAFEYSFGMWTKDEKKE